MIQHPEIDWIERTGYPSWMQGRPENEPDEDEEYEMRKDDD